AVRWWSPSGLSPRRHLLSRQWRFSSGRALCRLLAREFRLRLRVQILRYAPATKTCKDHRHAQASPKALRKDAGSWARASASEVRALPCALPDEQKLRAA